jgi:hypothetical protein
MTIDDKLLLGSSSSRMKTGLIVVIIVVVVKMRLRAGTGWKSAFRLLALSVGLDPPKKR